MTLPYVASGAQIKKCGQPPFPARIGAPLRNAILRSNLADSAVADADIMRAFRADLAWYGNPPLRARAFLDFPFIP